MDYMIVGNVAEDSKIIVLEQGAGEIEFETDKLAGEYVIHGLTNTPKIVMARRLSDGKFLGYGSVIPAEGAVGGNDEYTKLLINSNTTNESTDFLDSAIGGNAPHAITVVGDCKHSTDQQKYGTTSIKFSSGNYLSFPLDTDWNLHSYDFTFDFWVYHNNSPTGYEYYFDRSQSNRRCWITRRDPNGKLNILLGDKYNNPFFFNVTTTEVIPSGAWHHVAIVKDSSVIKPFLDGTLMELTPGNTHGGQLNAGTPMTFGGYGPLDAYVDEIRLSNIARWSESFTPEGPYTLKWSLP